MGWIRIQLYLVWGYLDCVSTVDRVQRLHCGIQTRRWPWTGLSLGLCSTAALSGRDSVTCFPASLWIAASTSLQPVHEMRSTFKEIQHFFLHNHYFCALIMLLNYTLCLNSSAQFDNASRYDNNKQRSPLLYCSKNLCTVTNAEQELRNTKNI